jgi:RepB DNA-primase from phage plasmid/Family of unknown function (DUF5906)
MNEDPHRIVGDAAGAEATTPPLNRQSRERANGVVRAEIYAHVELLHRLAEPFRGRGKLIVASYGQSPVTGNDIPPKVLHFEIGEIDPMVEQIVLLSHEQHRNIYIPLAILAPDLPPRRKGDETQVVAVLGLVADFDDINAANYRERMPAPANYVIETSPGRFQAFLLFDEPLEPGRAKQVARLLKHCTGCDHGTADVSHVWRVAGTLNWPNKKKVDQGRSATPQAVNAVQPWGGSLTAIETLKAAFNAYEKNKATEGKNKSNGEERKRKGNGGGGANHDEDNVPPELLKLIRDGVDQGRRSVEFFRAVAWLKQLGWTIPAISNLLEQYPRGIAEKYAGRITIEVARAYGKVQGHRPIDEGVSLNDFHAYMPMHNYIYAPSREPWPASSVDARVPPVPVLDANGKPVRDANGRQKRISASAWLDRNSPVEQMTWAPGLPMLIPNRLISEGGWIDRNKVTCFNLYRPPTIELGNAAEATPWLDHAHKVFGRDSEHIVKWCAHRVQRPQEKINHALVLGGAQGIGKDTLLEPVKRTVGPWNFHEVSPQHMLGRFNGFVKAVILRVSEARDLGDVDRFQFYDHMKAYTAAPPDVLRIDEKYLREHSVPNCCGVIITTNHKTDGIYLPADDRRHFVAWSDLKKEDFVDDYWRNLWGFYDRGGNRHVAAYLAELDISSFDPKAPPPKTPAFWDIVDANRAPEDAELADVLDKMGNPDATTLFQIESAATGLFRAWISDRKNRRVIPHRLEKCGYVQVRNDAAKDGLWKISGHRQAVYARSSLPIRERITAANELADQSSQ